MVVAAGLLGAVAIEERPVLRTPVIEPEAVLFEDELAEAFLARVRDCTVQGVEADPVQVASRSQRIGNGSCDPPVSVLIQVKSVPSLWLSRFRPRHEVPK